METQIYLAYLAIIYLGKLQYPWRIHGAGIYAIP